MQYLGVVITVLAIVVVIMLCVAKIKKKRAPVIFDLVEPPVIGPASMDEDFSYSDVIVKKKGKKTISNKEHEIFMEDLEVVEELDDGQSLVSEPIDSEEITGVQILHVMAKGNKVFAGYELLQALLSSGFRFGKMAIFHYYQPETQQKEVLFSLASAVEPGVFDMQNMGAFVCPGLTLFMQPSGNSIKDKATYALMIKTAQHLKEDLDGVLLNKQKQLMH